jgi:cytochrome c
MHAGLALAAAAWVLAFSAGCRTSEEPRIPNLSGDEERGRHLMSYYGCGSCHTIPKVAGANTVVGPPLWGMADRGYIGGVLPNTEEAMVRWLMNPQAVATRTAMPNLYVTEQDARDMTAFLFTLRAEPVIVRMLRGYIERATGRPSSAPIRSPEAVAGGE